jgi:hypothetical protein
LYVKSITGRAMKNGAVSKIHVRRVSFGEIPDQTQKTDTISSNTSGYLPDDIWTFILYLLLFIDPKPQLGCSGELSAV